MTTTQENVRTMNARCSTHLANLWELRWSQGARDCLTQVWEGEPVHLLQRSQPYSLVRVAHYHRAGWIDNACIEETCTPLVGSWLGEQGGHWLEVVKRFVLADVPYRWGGLSDQGIDCSGLIHLAWRLAYGRIIPRDAHLLESCGIWVRGCDLTEGDLIFYGQNSSSPWDGPATHVAVFSHFASGQKRVITHARALTLEDKRVVTEEEPASCLERARGFLRLPPDLGYSLSLERMVTGH